MLLHFVWKQKNHKVTLIEKHNDLGGRARVFRKNGFTFDGGPTVITAPYLIEELFNLFNKESRDYIKLTPLKTWYQFIFEDNSKFNYSGNEIEMEKQIEQIEKKDVDGYSRLVKFTKKIFDKGYLELADVPFDKVHFAVGYRAHEYEPGNIYNVKGINVTAKGKMDKIGWLAGYQDAELTGNIWNAGASYDLNGILLSAEYVHRSLTDETKVRNIVLGADVGFEQFSTHEFAKHLSLNLGYAIATGSTTGSDGFAATLQFKHQL